MDLCLQVGRIGQRPPPQYSPNEPLTEDDDGELPEQVRFRRPNISLLKHRPTMVPGAAQTARILPKSPSSLLVPQTERFARPGQRVRKLEWGPVHPPTPRKAAMLPKALVYVPENGGPAELVANLLPGTDKQRLLRQTRLKVVEGSSPRRPPIKLPRCDSAKFRRDLIAFTDRPERSRRDERRRELPDQPVIDSRQRKDVELLSSWVDLKLSAAIDDQGKRVQFSITVVATAIDDLIRQITAHMAERGALLAYLIDLDRKYHGESAELHERKAVDDVQVTYRQRILTLTSTQRRDAERETEERMMIWNECERMKAHLEERDLMLAELQQQTAVDIAKRDDMIESQMRTIEQLERSLDDLSVNFAQVSGQMATLNWDLIESKETIADLRLNLKFANERATTTTSPDIVEIPQKPVADDQTEESADKAEELETVRDAAIRIQSLVRGRQSRRLVARLSPVVDQPPFSDVAVVIDVPESLRRLFQCAPEVHASYFPQMIPLPKMMKWVKGIFLAKPEFDFHYAKRGAAPLRFADLVYDYYLSQHSLRESAEMDLMDLCHNISLYRSECARIRLFSSFLSEPPSPRVTDATMIVHEALRLYAAGPFETVIDNCQGVCWVDVESVLQIVSKLLKNIPNMASALKQLQNRAKTLSVARTFTGASRSAHKGTDKYMDLDDCLEVIWELFRQEDARLNTQLTEAFDEYMAQFADKSTDRLSLNDFEAVLKQFDGRLLDGRLYSVEMYREAGRHAIGQQMKIEDLVRAARNGGILPISIETDQFPRMVANRIRNLAQDSGGVIAVIGTTDGLPSTLKANTDEQVQMMQKRLASMREKVIDTGNTWKAKLERMQQKYDGVSSKLRAEYDMKLADAVQLEREKHDKKMRELEEAHSAKLQLCFEKFEERRNALEAANDDGKAKLKSMQNEFKRVSEETAEEKDGLYKAVDQLTMQLEKEVANSSVIANEVVAQTSQAMSDFGQATTLLSRQLIETTSAMERARMAEEDVRTRMQAQAVRQANESTMLRRSKLARGDSFRIGSDLQQLVASVPPISTVEFQGIGTGHQRAMTAGVMENSP